MARKTPGTPPPTFAKHQVKVNGRKLFIIATTSSYLPQFRTPTNGFTVFVCGDCYATNDRKTVHATAEEAVAQAALLAKRLNGAVFPLDPWLF